MTKVSWTVTGTLQVGNIPDAFQIDRQSSASLGGVSLQIFAKEGPTWNLWGSVLTKSDGSFSLAKEKDPSNRKFKIKAKFKNAKTVVYGDSQNVLSTLLSHHETVHSLSTGTYANLNAILTHTSKLTFKADSYTIYETPTAVNGRTGRNHVVNIVIGPQINYGMSYRHALIWYGINKLRVHLRDAGFPYKKRIAIKYPHNNKLVGDKVEQAYCSPINNCVYLTQNSRIDNLVGIDGELSLETLYHEAMHLWAYDYSTGEDGMAWQLIVHGSTHDTIQAKPFVAFHEAFAEISSRIFLKEIFNFEGNIYENPNLPFKVLPFKKDFLKKRKVIALNRVELSEIGWMHVFNTLMCRELMAYDLNDVQDENEKYAIRVIDRLRRKRYSLSIYDILETFRTPFPIHKNNMTLNGFMQRVNEVVEEYDQQNIDGFLKLFDVNNTESPYDIF